MRLLLAGSAKYPPFAPAWKRALRELGHTVQFFDYDEYGRSKIVRQLIGSTNISRLNRDLIREVERHPPDVAVLHNGHYVTAETVSILRCYCRVAGYHHDDPFGEFSSRPHFRRFRKAIPEYDSHHVIRQVNVEDFANAGASDVFVLPTYYVPWLHYPVNSEKIYDVVFVGHAENDRRIDYVNCLLKHNVRLRIFGPEVYWKRYLPSWAYKALRPIHPVLGDSYRRTLSQAKICLAFYSTANRDNYAYRAFEIPACGSFMLAESSPVLHELYADGEEVSLFSDPDELVEKVKYYLMNPEQRERIAVQGCLRCTRSGYDILSRMDQFISDVSGVGD